MKKIPIISLAAFTIVSLSGCEEDPAKTNMGALSKPATLEITGATQQNVPKEGGIAVFDLESSQVVFEINIDRPWCTAYIDNNERLVVKAAPNVFNNTRTAQVTIKAGMYDNVSDPRSVSVTQAAGSTLMPQLGEIFDNGVVFWTQTDPTPLFKVVSLTRLYGADCRWSTEQIETVANDPDDGLLNQNIIIGKDISKYPAFNYCHQMEKTNGLSWYLPARNEFVEIMKLFNGGELPSGTGMPQTLTPLELQKRAAFEQFLAANGGDVFNQHPDNHNGDSYWISNESTAANSYYVRVGAYTVSAGAKTSTARGARCVKTYDLK